MLWHEIVYVLSVAINGLTKYDIAAIIVTTTGKPVTPEQTNSKRLRKGATLGLQFDIELRRFEFV